MELITFEAALQKAQEAKDSKLNLLLGNGFSIDFNPKFSQEELFQQSSQAKTVCSEIKTFEEVARTFNELRASKASPAEEIRKKKVLEDFIKTLNNAHPDDSNCITDTQSRQCANFLNKFQAIYTVNYDLLLYWVILKADLTDKFKDGFRESYLKGEDYLTWYPSDDSRTNIRYLHGGLHLYLVPNVNRIAKYRYSNGNSLKQQITAAFDNNQFPIFVAGGTSEDKREIINQSDYLTNALKQLQHADGSLFIHGFNFNDNDQHILEAIASNTIEKLFISIHSSSNKENIVNAIKEINNLTMKSQHKNACQVVYYSAETAAVWREVPRVVTSNEPCLV